MSALTNLTIATSPATASPSFSLPYFRPTHPISFSPRSANAATETVTTTATAIIIPPTPHNPHVTPPTTITTTTKPRKTEYWGFPISWVTSTKTVYDWDGDGVEDWKTAVVPMVGMAMGAAIDANAGDGSGHENGDGDVDFDALAAAVRLTVHGGMIPSTLATVTRPSAALPSATGPASASAFSTGTGSASTLPVPTAPAVSVAGDKRDKNFLSRAHCDGVSD